MEGDAGTSRLNPTDADDSSPTEVKPEDSSESEGRADQTSTEVKPEDSSESEGRADQTSTEVKPEDSSESEVRADQTEVAALPKTNAEDDASEAGVEPGIEDEDLPSESAAELEDDASSESVGARGPSRLGRGWLIGIAAVLLMLAGGVGFGGLKALQFHQDSQTIARNDAAATRAAQDCVAATQAPDTNAISTAATKMIECSTGDFGAQAALYSGLLAEAYQAANAHVQVSDMRAAVEHNNDDGSIDVLVALRTKVTNSDAKDQEQGYRLRVRMTLADGQYKISKLDQVTK